MQYTLRRARRQRAKLFFRSMKRPRFREIAPRVFEFLGEDAVRDKVRERRAQGDDLCGPVAVTRTPTFARLPRTARYRPPTCARMH